MMKQLPQDSTHKAHVLSITRSLIATHFAKRSVSVGRGLRIHTGQGGATIARR